MIKKFSIFFLFVYSVTFYFSGVINQKNFKLSWDEIDYVNASRLGVIENIFEFNSKNIIEHINDGLTVRKIIDLDENALSIHQINKYKQIYFNDDIFELRHYHPPLLNVLISIYLKINPIEKDINLIKFKKFYNSCTIFFTLIILFLILRNKFSYFNIITSLLFISIFFSSPYYIRCINIINYHFLFGLITLIYCYGFYKFINKTNLKNIIRLSFFSFLLFFCLETAIVIFILSIIYYILINRNVLLKRKLKNIFFIILFTLLLILILWPANVYNLSLFKTFSMYFYRIFLSSFSEYSNLSTLNQIYLLIFNNLLISMLISYLVIIYIFFYNNIKSSFVNFLFFISVSYFIFLLFFMHNTNYLYPVILLIIIACCLIINKIPLKYNVYFFFLNIFLLSFSIQFVYDHNIDNNNINNENNIFSYLNTNNNHNLYLVDGSHIFEYYSKDHTYFNLNLYSKESPKFYLKFQNNYYNLESLIKNNFFHGIIIQSNRQYDEYDYQFLYKSGYKLDNTFDNYLFFNY